MPRFFDISRWFSRNATENDHKNNPSITLELLRGAGRELSLLLFELGFEQEQIEDALKCFETAWSQEPQNRQVTPGVFTQELARALFSNSAR